MSELATHGSCTILAPDSHSPLLVRGHRDMGKDVVTAVTHHDINGMNSVSTVAVKDVDVQLTSLSGYETYV